MRKYKAYSSYKDSNSPWFPVIPDHWEILSNRYIFDLKKSQVGKSSNKYTLLSLTLNGVIERDMVNPSGKFPAEFDTYQEVKKGDFIFCLFDVEETPRTVGLSNYDGMITGAYTVFNNRLAQNADYLYYFFLSLDDNKQLKPLYKGLRNTITKENFYSFKTPIPPIEEQTAIANFLDKKTAEIKEFIRLKEKTIELLKERKTAIINQAVTKGLDPNVEMKDSGIEWLGEIPKHWEVKKLKYLMRITNGQIDPKKKKYRDLTLIAPNHIEKSSGRILTLETASEQNAESGKYLVEKGDVIYSKIRPELRKACLAEFSIGMCSADMYPMKPNKDVLAEFLKFIVIAEDYSKYMIELSMRVAMPKVNRDDVINYPAVMPKIEEQREIVKEIHIISEQIDQAISQAKNEITLIKEYQQSIISEAVTGKIDVREEITK